MTIENTDCPTAKCLEQSVSGVCKSSWWSGKTHLNQKKKAARMNLIKSTYQISWEKQK